MPYSELLFNFAFPTFEDKCYTVYFIFNTLSIEHQVLGKNEGRGKYFNGRHPLMRAEGRECL